MPHLLYKTLCLYQIWYVSYACSRNSLHFWIDHIVVCLKEVSCLPVPQSIHKVLSILFFFSFSSICKYAWVTSVENRWNLLMTAIAIVILIEHCLTTDDMCTTHELNLFLKPWTTNLAFQSTCVVPSFLIVKKIYHQECSHFFKRSFFDTISEVFCRWRPFIVFSIAAVKFLALGSWALISYVTYASEELLELSFPDIKNCMLFS